MGTYHSNIPEYMSHYPGVGWLKPLLSAFFRHQYNFLQALYVPTPYIHRHLTETSKMDKVTDLGIWGRGIDLEKFSPKHRSRAFRHQMGFDDHDVVIMWCGRLVPEKRPDIFCNVVRKLHQRNVPFKALVVGAGPVEEEVKDLPNTVFAGWMSGDELSTAYASSDIFLFPSAVETFGNVTLEAAASGLPLVVEAGCSGHLVNHGVNGFACQDDDFDAYFDSTLCLVVDDVRRRAMSLEGRRFSMQFEQREVCKRMLVNYSKVTDDFYRKYGGRHQNRDKEYNNEDSFLGGNHPRPTLLVLVELLFILIFMVMYQMASFFFFIRERLLPTRHVEAPARPHRVIKSVATTTPKAASPPRAPLEEPLHCIDEVEEGCDSDSDTQDGHLKKMIVLSSSSKSDDDTESTASIGDDWSTSGKSRTACCTPPTSDVKISHLLAIGFVKLVLLQFRLESRVRNLASSSFSSSRWTKASRKRKDSSMEVDLLDLEKHLADSDSLSDDMEYLVNSSREDRVNMRRSNLALATCEA